MAARKPKPESGRARAAGALFDSIVSLPIDGPRPIGRTGLIATPLDKDLSFINKYAGYNPKAQDEERARYEAALLRVQRRLSALEPASKVWDGADIEAVELIKITSAGLSLDKKIELIAARLRKIAQGPRKWGPLR